MARVNERPAEVDDETAVAAAEREAVEAERLAEALAERVREGEDISPAELASAKDLGVFARLRVEAARRKAAKVKERQRQAALAELAGEVRAHERDDEALVALVDGLDRALKAVLEGFGARNAAIKAYADRCRALGVPLVDQAGHPGHAGLGLSSVDDGVFVDSVRLTPMSAGQFVAGVIHRAVAARALAESNLPRVASAGLEHRGTRLDRLVGDFSGLHGPHDFAEYIRRYA